MDKSKKSHKNKKSHKTKRTNGAQPVQVVKRGLSMQKRSELSVIVKQLTDITYEVVRDEWSQYKQIQELLARVMAIEAVLPKRTENSSPDARLSKIEAFYTWATKSDIIFDGVKIMEFPGYGLGLVAERDLSEEELFITVPRKAVISEEILDEANFHDMPRSLTLGCVKLCYALIIEYLRPDGPWRPYIDVLPESYSIAPYFSLADMECLRSSNALSAALRQCKLIARQYAVLYKFIHDSTPASPLAQLVKENYSYELFRWAASTVMTRQNSIPSVDGSGQVSVLIPFWDMANHQHGKLTTFYQADSNVMTSSAMRGFKKGEQVFIHYGNRPNFEFLVFNGFVQPSFSHDYIPIKLGLNSSDPLVEKRTRLLDMMNIGTLGTLNVLNGPEYISPTLLAFVRVFHMSNEQLDHWLTAEERVMDLMHSDCALETVLETKVWSFLSIRLNLLIRYSRTSLEDLERKFDAYNAGDLELNYTSATCLHFRLLEMRILTAAADYATQRSKA